MPEPLPDEFPHHPHHSEEIEGIRQAYSILRVEQVTSATISKIEKDTPHNAGAIKSHKTKLMYVRVLEYLIGPGPNKVFAMTPFF